MTTYNWYKVCMKTIIIHIPLNIYLTYISKLYVSQKQYLKSWFRKDWFVNPAIRYPAANRPAPSVPDKRDKTVSGVCLIKSPPSDWRDYRSVIYDRPAPVTFVCDVIDHGRQRTDLCQTASLPSSFTRFYHVTSDRSSPLPLNNQQTLNRRRRYTGGTSLTATPRLSFTVSSSQTQY